MDMQGDQIPLKETDMIQYDTPIEVTEEQYHRIVKPFGMIIAHRSHEGRYYIKLWAMRYKKHLQHELDK